MPSPFSVVAIGVSLLIAVPILALADGGGTGCPVSAGTPTSTAGALQPSPVGGGATPASGRDAEQTAVAATIIDVGRTKQVPPWGWVIAVATAIQEAQLRNLPGGDRDSIGVFQQRPSQGWGTPAQLASVSYQASRFYDALQAIPDWQRLPLTQAAQTVQRSAHPDAYAAWTDEAIRWVAQLAGQDPQHLPPQTFLAPASCTGGDGIPAEGTPELPDEFTLPPGIPAQVFTAVSWALAQRGTPYSYGGDCTAPHSGDLARACDCSSLVQMAYQAAAVNLPRTTGDQVRTGTPVPDPAHLLPGDLVFIPGTDGTARVPGHVGLYIGDGLVVHAPHTGDVVRLVSLSAWQHMISAIRRPVPG